MVSLPTLSFVDYFFNDSSTTESVNFHETKVTATADFTANFALTAVNVDRDAASQTDEDVAADCTVTAYFCDESNANVDELVFAQGDILTVCVAIHEADAGK